MYAEEKINDNSNCFACKKSAIASNKELVNGPIPIFHIGKNFNIQTKKLLIIGLVAYGWKDIFPDFEKIWHLIRNRDKEIHSIQNKIENRVEQLFTIGGIKYYDYLNYALKQVYGYSKTGFDSIALSNLVHCNNNLDEDTTDSLPQSVREYCIGSDKLGLIYKEINILKPTHVLILTQQYKYTRYLDELPWDKIKYKEIDHPSSRGRVKEDFAYEILEFMNNE